MFPPAAHRAVALGLHPLGPKKFSRLSDRVSTTSRLWKHSPSRQVVSSSPLWIRTVRAVLTLTSSGGSSRFYITWEDTKVSWYSTATPSAAGAEGQANTTGETYYYLLLGFSENAEG